jgi:hypothetical protein
VTVPGVVKKAICLQSFDDAEVANRDQFRLRIRGGAGTGVPFWEESAILVGACSSFDACRHRVAGHGKRHNNWRLHSRFEPPVGRQGMSATRAARVSICERMTSPDFSPGTGSDQNGHPESARFAGEGSHRTVFARCPRQAQCGSVEILRYAQDDRFSCTYCGLSTAVVRNAD